MVCIPDGRPSLVSLNFILSSPSRRMTALTPAGACCALMLTWISSSWHFEAVRQLVPKAVPKELPQCCCCFLVARKFFSRAVTGRLDNKPVFSNLRLSCDLTSHSTWCCKRWQHHQSPLNTGLDIVTGLSLQALPWVVSYQVKTLFLRLRYRPSDCI